MTWRRGLGPCIGHGGELAGHAQLYEASALFWHGLGLAVLPVCLHLVFGLTSRAVRRSLGVCGEAGELADVVKKEVIYGKDHDRKHLVEELGDLRFYTQAVMNLNGITEQEVLQQNANKLCVRYKQLRYSDESAIAREDKAGS